MIRVPDDQVPTTRPRAPSPVPAPVGHGWTPQNVVWMVVMIATALGLPALISGVIIPALRERPAAATDLSIVASRASTERADLYEDLDRLRKSCASKADLQGAESQIAGALERISGLEKAKRKPAPKVPRPAPSFSAAP